MERFQAKIQLEIKEFWPKKSIVSDYFGQRA